MGNKKTRTGEVISNLNTDCMVSILKDSRNILLMTPKTKQKLDQK